MSRERERKGRKSDEQEEMEQESEVKERLLELSAQEQCPNLNGPNLAWFYSGSQRLANARCWWMPALLGVTELSSP